MFKLILILLLVFLLVRTIVSGFWAFFMGATEEEPKIKNQDRRREGEVTIENHTKLNKKVGKDDGQYIDYEEVK